MARLNSLMRFKCLLHIPKSYTAVSATWCQHIAVFTESQGINCVTVATEILDSMASAQVPDFDSSVVPWNISKYEIHVFTGYYVIVYFCFLFCATLARHLQQSIKYNAHHHHQVPSWLPQAIMLHIMLWFVCWHLSMPQQKVFKNLFLLPSSIPSHTYFPSFCLNFYDICRYLGQNKFSW